MFTSEPPTLQNLRTKYNEGENLRARSELLKEMNMTYKFNRLSASPLEYLEFSRPKVRLIYLFGGISFASMWKILKQGHKHSILCKVISEPSSG
ncbi:hypothetical protein CEXT_688881 [Caerostris extrusa]|uniref:Uncharacterized protein n=1 Tax=Caerostris extrusa TaxID=172846 RepID=A0AAV4VRU1_CAEEX|nr:hypothetical protein CEXT_688881 [Caerostris extrusa]